MRNERLTMNNDEGKVKREKRKERRQKMSNEQLAIQGEMV